MRTVSFFAAPAVQVTGVRKDKKDQVI